MRRSLPPAGAATEWFRVDVPAARAAVIQACLSVNMEHRINPAINNHGGQEPFVVEHFAGAHPHHTYSEHPEAANEGHAANKMEIGGLR